MSRTTSPELFYNCRDFLEFVAKTNKWKSFPLPEPNIIPESPYTFTHQESADVVKFGASGEINFEVGDPIRFYVAMLLICVRSDLLVAEYMSVTCFNDSQEELFLRTDTFCNHIGYAMNADTQYLSEKAVSNSRRWIVYMPKSIEMLFREYDAVARLYHKEPVFRLPER